MKRNFVYSNKKQPVYAIIRFIFGLILRKPKIVNLNEELPKNALMVSPHMGKWGPFYLSLHFPEKFAIIGASPMVGTYKERYSYLRNVLYIQKCHKGKVFSTIKAAFEAFFSIYIYKGMHIIPSYEDIRLLNTINYTQKTMENGLPVLMFPEVSDEGYQKVLTTMHEGFISIARAIDRRRKEPTKIYPMYEHVKRRIVVIGKPFTLKELEGKTNEEVLKYTADRINELNPYLEEDMKSK